MVRAAGLAVAVLLLGSCGDTGSADRPAPTSTRSVASPTATLPDPTRSPDREETATAEPTRTRSPEREETTATSEPEREETTTTSEPERTRSPEREETTATSEPESPRSSVPQAAPSPTQPAPPPSRTEAAPSPTQPAQEPTSDPEQTIAPTEAETPAGPPPTSSPSVQPTSAEADGTPTWLWWTLGAILVALAVGIPLLVRASHRRDWRADLASAEEEVAWFARVLIPELRSQPSPEEAAGGWNITESRITALEDRLTALEPTAPDESAQQRALALRDAVRAARADIRRLLESGSPDTIGQDLDAVAAQLEQVLGVPDPLA
ncbi:hypothetical protein [Kribbella sp. NPDC050470]|uniref:hypothetical protein n=1 Tax=unclassified Kribbella TaxID=2644121 RepID=UPI0037A26012